MTKYLDTPTQVLLRFYQAEAAYMQSRNTDAPSDFGPMRETLDPDVVLHQSPDLPFGGDYHGFEGYERWAVAMSALFDQLAVQDQMFFEQDDTVVVTCRLVTRSRSTGVTLDLPMVQVVTVKAGKITEFRPFYWNVPAYTAAVQTRDQSANTA